MSMLTAVLPVRTWMLVLALHDLFYRGFLNYTQKRNGDSTMQVAAVAKY